MGKTYAPKATFTVTVVKGQRHFTAVNKRAKRVAKSVGKRKYLTLQELKSCVGKGTYKFYQYVGEMKDGNLKAIRF